MIEPERADVVPKDMTQLILERLHFRIRRSRLTQRAIESRVGFSRGYLSQILGGTVELKFWQLLAILHAMELDPSEFFGELFPRFRVPALETLDDVARHSEEGSLTYELARLFAIGIETVLDVCDGVARCEAAIEELIDLGFFDGDAVGDQVDAPATPRGTPSAASPDLAQLSRQEGAKRALELFEEAIDELDELRHLDQDDGEPT